MFLTISGLRGIFPEELTPEIVKDYALTFGIFCNRGTILIARDARKSGKILTEAAISGLRQEGCKIVDAGLCPTPTAVFLTRSRKADGGTVVTASHNPVEWNGMKFIKEKGRFLNQDELNTFGELLRENNRNTTQKSGVVEVLQRGINEHIETILDYLQVREKRNGLKVGIDACNGSASFAAPTLLKRMGCDVFEINCNPDGTFPRGGEPNPANLQDLSHMVKAKKLDLGFGFDPDGDRLGFVDEKGEPRSEELTLALCCYHILKKQKGAVVVNLSTSSIIDHLAREFDVKIYRTPVGETHVVEKMLEIDAVIGGEGNGGVIYPYINLTRDGLSALAMIIQLVLEENKTISAIMERFPKYHMQKSKISIEDRNIEWAFDEIKAQFKGMNLDLRDGIKIISDDFWAHVRSSNTEPVLRIIAESKKASSVSEIIEIITQAAGRKR